jgi:signal transduction histidine kinase
VGARVRSWRSYPIVAAAVAFATGAGVFAGMAVAIPVVRGETVLVVLWCVLCAGGVGVAAWRLGPVFGVPWALAAAVSIDSFYIAPYRTFDSREWVNYAVTAMYIAIGVFVGAVIEATQRRAASTEAARSRLAEEQAVLRRIATLIAQGGPPEGVFAAVAGEMRQLVAADVTRIIRIEPDGTATLVGGTNPGDQPGPLGPIEPGLATAEVLRTGRTARIDNFDQVDPETVARWYGATGPSPHAVASPVVVAGSLWGTIVAGSLDGPLPEETELRMAELTELLAIAIANASSRAELTASRARVVVAGDHARRRFERNLHDGVQQRLVSLALWLRRVERRLPDGDAELKAALSEAVQELNATTDDVREIAQGIHPAILTQGGLGPALRNLALRSSVPVEVVVQHEERLPEPVEVAAYYVAAEALTNAAKHAAASSARMTLERDDGLVRLRISDDGSGGADPSTGSGLTGIRDRIEALGGSLAVVSPPGRGTVLEVALPVVSTDGVPQASG